MTRRSLLLAAVSLVALACSKPDAAIEPVWEKQPCAHCSMILSDRRFGAQLLDADGDRYFFDDVGCMVAFEHRTKTSATHEWVKDAEGGGWSEARSARYADGAASPMGFGFEARSSGTRTWSDLEISVVAREEASR